MENVKKMSVGSIKIKHWIDFCLNFILIYAVVNAACVIAGMLQNSIGYAIFVIILIMLIAHECFWIQYTTHLHMTYTTANGYARIVDYNDMQIAHDRVQQYLNELSNQVEVDCSDPNWYEFKGVGMLHTRKNRSKFVVFSTPDNPYFPMSDRPSELFGFIYSLLYIDHEFCVAKNYLSYVTIYLHKNDLLLKLV